MIQLLRLLCGALIGLVRSSARREAEILVLRHQINVLRRKSPNRPALSNVDRLLFVLLSRLVPSTLDALSVIKPATVIRWHRAGFRAYWRWKSRPRGGRPRMSHGEAEILVLRHQINVLRRKSPNTPATRTRACAHNDLVQC